MTRPLRDLPRDTRVRYPGETAVFVVADPASEDQFGWVGVRNLSMPDEEVKRLAEAGDGDPRSTVIALPVNVEVLP
jgi:hypothetical protein